MVQKSTTFREPTESEHATAVDLYATRVDFIASRLLDRFAVLDKVSSVKIAAYIMSVVAEILIEEAKIRTVEEARHPGAKLAVTIPTALQVAASRFEPDIALAVEGREGTL